MKDALNLIFFFITDILVQLVKLLILAHVCTFFDLKGSYQLPLYSVLYTGTTTGRELHC